MNGDDGDALSAARQQAQADRARLKGQVAATRDRLAPARLRDDAVEYAHARISDLRHETVAHVRQHPIRTAFGLAALAAWVARKPLLAHAPPAISAAYGWLSGHLRFSEEATNDVQSDSLPDDAEHENLTESYNDNERILP